jgi:hypothetical protein
MQDGQLELSNNLWGLVKPYVIDLKMFPLQPVSVPFNCNIDLSVMQSVLYRQNFRAGTFP